MLRCDTHSDRLLFFHKTIFNNLDHQNDLIYGGLPVSKTHFCTRDQWVDDKFDMGIIKSFEDFVGDAKQRDGTIAFCIF